MTALLAIVKTVAEADTAARAGVDRVAIVVDDGAGLERTLSVLKSHGGLDRSRLGLMLGAWVAGAVDPASLANEIRGTALGTIWLPFAPARSPLWPAAVSQGLPVVGLVSADVRVDATLCAEARTSGLSGLLLSEEPFARTRLLDRRTLVELAGIVPLCREHGLAVAFSGGIEQPDIPRLLVCGPDELGVDSALLGDAGALEPERLAAVQILFARANREQVTTVQAAAVADRIFVRDYTVAMHIGAYQRERAASQRVRFSVEVEIAPPPTGRTGMAGVVSYDLVTDAIARLMQAHVDLVETLAEDLAGAVLAHPRALAVEITVEKLDVGPGSVGCRIVRRRP